jgi:hypothetical protein
MTEEVKTPETSAPQAPQPANPLYPIALTAQEVQGIIGVLRKLPMEQVEGLVYNITTQFNNIHASLQPKE